MRLPPSQFLQAETRLTKAFLAAKTAVSDPKKATAAWELCRGGGRSKLAALLARHVGMRATRYHQMSDTDADCYGVASFRYYSQAEVPEVGRIPELDRLGAQFVEGKLPLTPDPTLDRVMYLVKVDYMGSYWTYKVVFRFPGQDNPLVQEG